MKTGYSIPGDVEFEEYTGKSGKGRSKGRKARVRRRGGGSAILT